MLLSLLLVRDCGKGDGEQGREEKGWSKVWDSNRGRAVGISRFAVVCSSWSCWGYLGEDVCGTEVYVREGDVLKDRLNKVEREKWYGV